MSIHKQPIAPISIMLQTTAAQAPHSGQAKDGIKAAHLAGFRHLVEQAESLEALFKTCVNTEAVALDDAVDGAAGVADGDPVTAARVPWAGVLLRDGQYFLVDGQRLHAFEDLCLHGVMSRLDAAWFKSMEGLLRKVLQRAQSLEQAQQEGE